MAFGENLREARSKRNISQTELAEMIGVSGPMINQIERGTRQATPPIIAKLTKIFNCTADSLIFGDQSTA